LLLPKILIPFALKFGVRYNGGNLQLVRTVAGVQTTLFAPAITAPASSDIWKVVVNGSAINVYVKNVLTIAATDSNHITAAKIGVRGTASLANYIDSIEIITAEVTDVNGAGTTKTNVDVGATSTVTTTGMGTITSVTATGGGFSSSATPAMPAGVGSITWAWPWADGSIQAPFGDVSMVFADGSTTATITETLTIPTTNNSVTMLGATDLSEYHLGHVLTIPDDLLIYYPNANGVIILPNGHVSALSLPHTLNILLHNLQPGGDGSIDVVSITLNDAGAVVSLGLTTSGITSMGLTTSGLTSAGL